MTIDEAINHAREVAEHKREVAEEVWRKMLNKPDFPWGRDYTKEEVERKEKECVLRAEEHEQLAEWLEELKILRELKKTYTKGMETSYAEFRYKQGRKDAIDEYKEQLLENLIPMKDKYFDFAKKSTMPEAYTHIKRMDTVNIIIEMVKIKAEQLKG